MTGQAFASCSRRRRRIKTDGVVIMRSRTVTICRTHSLLNDWRGYSGRRRPLCVKLSMSSLCSCDASCESHCTVVLCLNKRRIRDPTNGLCAGACVFCNPNTCVVRVSSSRRDELNLQTFCHEARTVACFCTCSLLNEVVSATYSRYRSWVL